MIHWEGCGRRRRISGEDEEEEVWFPPCSPLPSAILTVSTTTRKTHTRPNLFYCSLLLSFLFLSLSVGVSQCLLFSPSLPLSLFSLSLPPLSAAIGGLVFLFFFFFSFWKDSWIFDVRHTHTGAAPCLTVIFLTNTCLFCNLCINYLMNHVTSWSGGGGQGVGWGGGCQYASPFVGPIRTSAVWCRTLS